MTPSAAFTDTILIVDDEESVRRTFLEWLRGANLQCQILSAPDAETALQRANEHTIDLAILDWALGAGDDGLQLLQDLSQFNPDVAAIMITGFANKATPLDAMRMGVRDYLDKNQDLNRESFLRAVRRQLERLRPVKRERQLHRSLVGFRDAVEKIVPLVQSTSALSDPVPLSEAVRGLLTFLRQVTHARDAVLVVRRRTQGGTGPDTYVAYGATGERLAVPLAPFSNSIAGSVASMQQASNLNNLSKGDLGGIELQPFERGCQALLAVPLPVSNTVQVVLELLDREGGTAFTAEDQRLLQASAVFGTDLLRQALSQHQSNQLLLDAVATALRATEQVSRNLSDGPASAASDATPPAVLDSLREGLQATSNAIDPADTLRIAETLRLLTARHGPAAVRHCARLIEEVKAMLDAVAGE